MADMNKVYENLIITNLYTRWNYHFFLSQKCYGPKFVILHTSDTDWEIRKKAIRQTNTQRERKKEKKL